MVAVVWSTARVAEVKNYNLVNRSAKKLSKAIEGKSQLDTKMTLMGLCPLPFQAWW